MKTGTASKPVRYSAFGWVTLLLFCGASTAAAEDVVKPEALFAVHAGQAPYKSIQSIFKKPTEISLSVTSKTVDGIRTIRSETDFHAIYPVPVKAFLDELLDYKDDAQVFPNISKIEVPYADPDPFGLHQVHEYISFHVLWFKSEYEFITNNYVEKYGNGYVQKFDLASSPDGRFYEMLGNCYIEALEFEGQPCTYVRQYSIIGLKKDASALTELAMRTFGAWQVRAFFADIYRAVQHRYEQTKTSP